MSRNFRTIKISLDEAETKRDLGMSGHSLKVLKAPAGFEITFFPNNATGKGITFPRGGGWEHMAFSKLTASWSAYPGKTATIACYGETTDENKDLTRLSEGQTAGSVEIANQPDEAVNVILRDEAGDALGTNANPLFTRPDEPSSLTVTGALVGIASAQVLASAARYGFAIQNKSSFKMWAKIGGAASADVPGSSNGCVLIEAGAMWESPAFCAQGAYTVELICEAADQAATVFDFRS